MRCKLFISFILILVMLIPSCVLAEGLLPDMGVAFDIKMPALSCMLLRYPDSEESLDDGSLVQTYNNISEDDFNRYSEYIGKYGCSLVDYSVEGTKFMATVEYMGKTFNFVYDEDNSTATSIYPSGVIPEKPNPIRLAKVGDVVQFGRYEQDNNLDNGAEEIDWIVVEKDNKSCLLLSFYGLDAKPYNDEFEEQVTWEKCTIRTWLNGQFFTDSFTDVEQAAIAESELSMKESEEFMTLVYYYNGDRKRGVDTKDKVYLLSVTEARTYIPEKDNRTAEPTKYALANGAYSDETEWKTPNGWWWLRSREYSCKKGQTCVVAPDGVVGGCIPNIHDYGGRNVNQDWIMIRPAIRINLSKLP